MDDLVAEVLHAHGGLPRWRELTMVRAQVVTTGRLFEMKGVPGGPDPREMSVWLHEQRASVQPFGPGQRTRFTSNRIAIEKITGELVAERENPRTSFAGHDLETPWDPLDRAYFNGYAMWTYLTTPFFLAMPGFQAREIDPPAEEPEKLRGLEVTFPPGIASHSTTQQLYFGDDFLLRRHDYAVEVAGPLRGAQYVSDYIEADGILLPSKRRAYSRAADGAPLLDPVMVSIDISDVEFE